MAIGKAPAPAPVTKSSPMAAGWGEVQEIIKRPRMIVSGRGEERAGKSQFGLTMPAPIAVFPFDNNTDELIQKFRRYKKILAPEDPIYFKPEYSKEEHDVLWGRFMELFKNAVASPFVRSIMVDTGTEMYELARLAKFGKLKEVPAHFYDLVNSEFKKLINLIYPSNKNLYITHRVKDQYVKTGEKQSARTGKRIEDGFNAVRYKVQINVLCWRDLKRRDDEAGTEGFGMTIDDCTQNETLAGTFLEEPDNNWQDLGKLVYPDSTDKDWV